MVTVPKDGTRGNAQMTGAEEPDNAIIITSNGPWDLDPATLVEKDVHELNVMIAERGDEKTPTFETTEEAVAWLSQNFSVEEVNVAVG